MDAQKIQHYGDELYQALVSRTPVEPLTNREPEITIDDAYQIQLRMIQRRLDAGEVVIGKKIGVTSKVVMDMLGVNQPDFGHLLSGMVFNEGEPVDTGKLIAPACRGRSGLHPGARPDRARASRRPTCCAPPTA